MNLTSTVDLFNLLKHSGLFIKLIVVLLFAFSLCSWAIIFNKVVGLRKNSRGNKIFSDYFNQINGLHDILNLGSQKIFGSYYNVYRHSIQEVKTILESAVKQKAPGTAFPMVKDTIERAVSQEELNLDRFLIFLAITSSACPFLGLLGTVWGVMHAFVQIGYQGEAGLHVIAPGIAEALVTTILGLLVAIPAVIFYNFFNNRIKRLETELYNFSNTFLNQLKLYYLAGENIETAKQGSAG